MIESVTIGDRLDPNEHATTYTFALDPFQLEAMTEWNAGRTVIVSAPTGTGKTIVAEFAIARALASGRKLVVTTPIKALSMQKLRDLRARFGDERIGVMTGDVTDLPEAPVVVMTTEILRNRLATEGIRTVARCDGVVFDEFHFIADPDRGRVWEETVLLLPPDVPLLCLSATIPNAGDLAGWLADEGRDTSVVWHDQRAVPLDVWYAYDDQFIPLIDANGRQHPVPEVGGERLAARQRAYERRRRERWASTGWYARDLEESDEGTEDEPERHRRPTGRELLALLDRRSMLPAIVFAFSRQRTQDAAEECLDGVPSAWLAAHREEIASAIERCVGQLSAEEQQLAQVAQLRRCLAGGVAFHHAGLIPSLKELVETLFAGGHLAAVCATDTLALGVNLPARTVVLEKLTRFTLEGHRPLTGREFQQLSGRAGRRGLDEAGHVVLLYDEWVRAQEAVETARRRPEPVESAFALDYASYLSLLRGRERADVRHLIRRSFRYYDPGESSRRRESRIATIIASQEEGLFRVLVDHDAIDPATHEVTDFGRQVARAYHPAALPLLSLLASPAGERLRTYELAEVAAWFASDRTPKDARPVAPLRLSRAVGRIFPDLVTDVALLNATERRCQLPMTPPPLPELVGLAWRWMRGESLGRLAWAYQLDEGDVLQAMGNAIGLLRLLADAVDDDGTRARLIAGVRSLWRDTLLGRFGGVRPAFADLEPGPVPPEMQRAEERADESPRRLPGRYAGRSPGRRPPPRRWDPRRR